MVALRPGLERQFISSFILAKLGVCGRPKEATQGLSLLNKKLVNYSGKPDLAPK
jgi:hypothetical protein